MYILLFYCLSIFGFMYVLVTKKWILPSFHFFAINAISGFTYTLLLSGIFESKMLIEFGIVDINYNEIVYVFYSILLFISLFVTVRSKLKQKDFTKDIEELFRNSYIKKRVLKSAPFFFLLAYLVIFYFSINVDWDRIYYNNEYLLITEPKKIGLVSTFPSFIHRMTPILGILSFIVLGILLGFDLGFLTLLILPACVFFLTLQLASNSRTASILFFSCAPFLIISGRRKLQILAIFMLILGFAVYNASIYGRGQYAQGISQISNNLIKGNFESSTPIFFFVLNIFNGAINLASSLEVGTDYPLMYKILSFSPLISEMDGFALLLKFEQRVNIYIPFGAYSELYFFGVEFWIGFAFFLFLFLSKANKDVIDHGVRGFLVWAPAYLFFMASQQYPIRNYFRFVLLSLIISVFLLKKNKK